MCISGKIIRHPAALKNIPSLVKSGGVSRGEIPSGREAATPMRVAGHALAIRRPPGGDLATSSGCWRRSSCRSWPGRSLRSGRAVRASGFWPAPALIH